MGMAPYGQPTRVEDVYKLFEVSDDGSFRLNMEYFSFHHSTSKTFNGRFTGLFGEPRVHESDFYTPTTHPKKDHPKWNEATAKSNQHYANIAASIRYVTETMLKMANYINTGLKKLSGHVVLLG
jgi:carbamoyltransferase